jgi:polysaccharide biosynthesis protein PslH
MGKRLEGVPNLRTRTLFVTTVLPSRRGSGSERASQSFIDALRSCGCEVSVIGYRRSGQGTELAPGERLVAERPIETAQAGSRALLWLGSSIVRGDPYSSAKYRSRAYARMVRAVLAEDVYDLVVLDHVQLGWVTRWVPRTTALVLVAHNLEHELYAAEAGHRSNPLIRRVYAREARLVRQAEQELGARADEVWALTHHDAAWFARLPGTRAGCFAIPSELGGPSDAAAAKSCDVGLVGTWTWAPNADGLRWFVDRVRPLLPTAVSIEVAGRGAEWLQGRYANVRYRGFVADAQAFMRRAGVVAVPATRGAGIQIKTLDAIASGSRVVVTPLGLRGIEDPPPSVAVARTAPEFAATIRARLRTPATARERAAGDAWSAARRARFLDQLAEALWVVLGRPSADLDRPLALAARGVEG